MGAEARPPRYGPLRLVAAAAGGAIFTLVFLRSPFSCPDVPGLVSSHNKPGSQLSIPAVAGTEAPVTNAEPPVTNAEPVSLGAKAKPDGVPWNPHFFNMLEDCGHVCKIEPDGVNVKKSGGKFFDEFRKTVDCHKLWSSPHMDVPGEGRPPKWQDLPKGLRELYSYGGAVGFSPYYFDQKFYGGKQHVVAAVHNWTSEVINDMIAQAKAHKLKGTYDVGATECLRKGIIDADLQGKSVLVIGSLNPWVEALCLAHGAAEVTTLEYATLYSSDARVRTLTPFQLSAAVESGLPSFDAIVTFSSIEHSGLGRYGDALNPFGDLITLARAWCLAKPDADLVLGTEGRLASKPTIYFNAHRHYANLTYAQLFANWKQMTVHPCYQSVFTLKKLPAL